MMFTRNCCFTLLAIAAILISGCASQPDRASDAQDPSRSDSVRYDPPDWYGIYQDSPGMLSGFGSAKTLEAARKQALADISQRMDVTVTSQTEQQTTVNNGRMDRRASTSIQLRSEQRIRNAQLLRQTRTPDGHYFIAMVADFRLTEQILADKLRAAAGHTIGKINWQGSPWLIHSDFIQKVTRYAVTDGPELNITTELGRENDRWLLTLNNYSEVIDAQDLPRLVAWRDSAPDSFRLGIKPLDASRGPHRLKAGDRFALTLSSDDAAGYFTLFNIYPDGRLTALLDSQPLAAKIEFPSPVQQKQGMVLVAETAEPGKASQDVILAIRTAEPVNTSQFQQASGQVADASSYKVHDLLTWLGKTRITAVSTVSVEIQPR